MTCSRGSPRKGNPQPSTLTPHPSTLNPQPSTLNPQPSTPDPQPPTLNPQPSTLNPQPSTLNPHPSTLNFQLRQERRQGRGSAPADGQRRPLSPQVAIVTTSQHDHMALSLTQCSSKGFGKSPLPQNRHLKTVKQEVDDFVGELTF